MELQAICRCDRQGQKKRVFYVRFFANNSDIDWELLHVQNKKTKLNQELMGPLVRCHNEGPEILDLEDYLPIPLWHDDDLDMQLKAERKLRRRAKKISEEEIVEG